MKEKNCLFEGKWSAEEISVLNSLYADKHFVAIAQFLQMRDMFTDKNRRILLKEALRANSKQASDLLDIDGWKMLSAEQLRVCIKHRCPPQNFIMDCIVNRSLDKFEAVVERYELGKVLLKSILRLKIFEIFSLYIRYHRLSSDIEAILYTKGYKEYRREYLKHHKIPFLWKIVYFLKSLD